MKRSVRILLVGAVLEALLFGIGAWLINQLKIGAMQPTNSAEETISVITSTLGSAMGVVAGLVIVLFLVARSKERQQP